MKSLLFLILLTSLNFGFTQSLYERKVEEIWREVATYRKMDPREGFLIVDRETFFSEAEIKLSKGERMLICFYPKGSGFEYLVEDDGSFIEIKEFFSQIRERGFKVNFCMPYRHMASFENIEELKEFISKTFHTTLKEGKTPLFFPTKIVILEMFR